MPTTSPEKYLEIKAAHQKIEEQGKLLLELSKAFLATYREDIKNLSYDNGLELFKRATSFEKKLAKSVNYIISLSSFLNILLGIEELFMEKPGKDQSINAGGEKDGNLLTSLFGAAAKKTNN